MLQGFLPLRHTAGYMCILWFSAVATVAAGNRSSGVDLLRSNTLWLTVKPWASFWTCTTLNIEGWAKYSKGREQEKIKSLYLAWNTLFDHMGLFLTSLYSCLASCTVISLVRGSRAWSLSHSSKAPFFVYTYLGSPPIISKRPVMREREKKHLHALRYTSYVAFSYNPSSCMHNNSAMEHACFRTSFTTQIQQCIAKPGSCVANYDAVPGKICLEEYTGLNFQSNMQTSSFDFARNLFSARIYFQPEFIFSQNLFSVSWYATLRRQIYTCLRSCRNLTWLDLAGTKFGWQSVTSHLWCHSQQLYY